MSSSSPSHYSILGISEDASDEDVKKAFRLLARRYHPDKKGDADKMQALNEAYSVLSDPEQRRKYDSKQQRQYQQQHHQNIFNQFFQRRSSRPPQPTPAAVVNVYLSVPEIVSGVDKIMDMEMDVQCSACKGCGAPDPSSVKVCSHCMGRGVFVAFIPPLQVEQPCMACNQKGFVISESDKCSACKGSGTNIRKRSYVLQIPSGITDKTEVLLKGKGPCCDPRNGTNADLQVFIHHHIERPYTTVQDKPMWLGYDMQVTLEELVMGFEREINITPNDNGKTKKIPIRLISDGYFNPTKNFCVVPGYGLCTQGSLKITFSVVFGDTFQVTTKEEVESENNNNENTDVVKIQVQNYMQQN